jgi:hypothetical protein
MYTPFKSHDDATLSYIEDSLYWENHAAVTKVRTSGANLGVPLSSQSYAKPHFTGLHNSHDGMHPDAMLNDFRALVDNTQDTMHHLAIFTGMQECFKHKNRDMPYILNDQQNAMELCIYHPIKVHVQGAKGEHISRMCSSTRHPCWWGGDQRNGKVWVMQRPGMCYGSLNWHLLWKLKCLCKIKLLAEDGGFVEYWLAQAYNTILESSGNFKPVSNCVQERYPLATISLQVFGVGNILG